MTVRAGCVEGEGPALSVVVTVHERVDGARAAVHSVLDATARAGVAAEVVVVDDGSGEDVATALDVLASDVVEVVHQPNLGLGAARVHGASVARGRWLAFLDDDDRVLPEWPELLAMAHDRVGIASGGVRFVSPEGRVVGEQPPAPLGPIFEHATANYLAGSFVVRRDVYEQAGGYLAGLSSAHQTELFIRCAAVCSERGLEVVHTDRAVVEIERRAKTERPLSNPRLGIAATRWVLARHADRFARDPRERANWEAVASLNAFRLDDPSAVTHALRAVRHDPTNPRHWFRVAALLWPRAARRRWGRVDQYRAPRGAQLEPLAHAASFGGTPMAGLATRSDHLFLPWRYRENPPASSDRTGHAFWEGGTERNDVRYQDPVYRWAATLLRRQPSRLLDVGCGSGDKLVRHLADHASEWLGVDQPSAIGLARRRFPGGSWLAADLTDESTWHELESFGADLVICADVIEHLEDPYELLRRLRRVASGGRLLLSTPDRSRLEGADRFGPPANPRHVREWSEPELRLLLDAAGLEVVAVRHLLPRRYSPTMLEAKRLAHRAFHLRAIPDRRTCMAFLLRPRPEAG